MIPKDVRYTMLKEEEKLSIRKQCELLCITRTKYYYKPQTESLVNLHIMRFMVEQYLRTPFYGFPRMFEVVKKSFPMWILNKKRIEWLYHKMGLRSVLPGPNTSKSDPKAVHKFQYLLKKLKIKRINQVWASDITYIPMPRGYMYLYAIIDLYSRYIINWGVSNTMSAEWCVTITKEAIFKWGSPEIFNTDQGVQFTSDDFVDLLKESNIKQSMYGKGRAIDNKFIERFWRTIKYEYVYINPANSGHELYYGLEEYFKYYNYERPHDSLEKETPAKKYGQINMNKISTKYSTLVV